MTVDLAELSDDDAASMVRRLVDQLNDARRQMEVLERRKFGIRKMISGLVELFPALEDLLPEDLDEHDDPRPRGAEAVLGVLADAAGEWYTVQGVVSQLARRGWEPDSSNPANAVRTALERLHERGAVEKARSTRGEVIYRCPKEDDEEPF